MKQYNSIQILKKDLSKLVKIQNTYYNIISKLKGLYTIASEKSSENILESLTECKNHIDSLEAMRVSLKINLGSYEASNKLLNIVEKTLGQAQSNVKNLSFVISNIAKNKFPLKFGKICHQIGSVISVKYKTKYESISFDYSIDTKSSNIIFYYIICFKNFRADDNFIDKSYNIILQNTLDKKGDSKVSIATSKNLNFNNLPQGIYTILNLKEISSAIDELLLQDNFFPY